MEEFSILFFEFDGLNTVKSIVQTVYCCIETEICVHEDNSALSPSPRLLNIELWVKKIHKAAGSSSLSPYRSLVFLPTPKFKKKLSQQQKSA